MEKTIKKIHFSVNLLIAHNQIDTVCLFKIKENLTNKNDKKNCNNVRCNQ